jgi:hypothetical protein
MEINKGNRCVDHKVLPDSCYYITFAIINNFFDDEKPVLHGMKPPQLLEKQQTTADQQQL